jgi:hypothetical protein
MEGGKSGRVEEDLVHRVISKRHNHFGFTVTTAPSARAFLPFYGTGQPVSAFYACPAVPTLTCPPFALLLKAFYLTCPSSAFPSLEDLCGNLW